ncbi:MAG: hypothetical protein P1U68_07770 [Verrucomicrobiales bacterium]|nr:hypothetical protein [Verrucomicrobiales bacterium]
MSDLMEQIEPELSPAIDQPKPFMSTDLNDPEAEAPEKARFESDRNTTAASELAPDPSQPQSDLPTTNGDSPLPYFALQNQEFTDGDFDQSPAAQGAATGADQPPAGTPPQSSITDAAPGEESGKGDSDEVIEGVDSPPVEAPGEKLSRPEESPTDGEFDDSLMVQSFDDPNSSTVSSAFGDTGPVDQFAASAPKPEESAEVGEISDPAQEKLMRAGGTGVDFENSKPADASGASGADSMNPADSGLFAEGFSPERIQNTTNGTLSNIGQNAVDAEGTEVGKYKNQVRKEISRMWHRYRLQHGDFVTYGILKLECRIDRHGKVHDLKVVENDANSVLAEFSLKAILDADLPPMTEEVAEKLGPVGLELVYDIIIY